MRSFSLDDTAPTVPPTSASRLEHTALLKGHGGIDKIEVKRCPLAVELADDEVEVEVYYCGVNMADNYLRLGVFRQRHFPVILGSECAGIVMRLGAAVADLQVGQGVLALRPLGGLWRRAVVLPRRCLFALPDNVSLSSAAALGLGALVAHHCLFQLGRLARGQAVFMHSIAGGVGTSVIQLARRVPDVTILGTASKSKHERALAMGVKHIFTHEENYAEKILKEYPEGVDIIINSNGAREMENCLKFLKPCGRLINLGTNGTITYPKAVAWLRRMPTWESRSISTAPLIHKNQTVAGVNIGYWLERYPQKVQSILNHIFQLRAAWKIKPCIHCKIDIEQAAMAVELLASRRNFGRVLLVAQEEPPLLNVPGHRIAISAESLPGNPAPARRGDNSAKKSAGLGRAGTGKQMKTVECRPVILEKNVTERSVGEHS